MGSKAWVMDEELALILENAVAAGADSNAEMAEALGLKPGAFANFKVKGGKPQFEERKNAINEAIKKGMARRREAVAAKAEYGLMKLIEGHIVEDEVTEIVKDEKTGKQSIKRRKMKKYIPPNATAVIFTLCNHMPNKYKSIHKMEEKDNSKGEIAQWLQEQANQGRQ